MHYYQHHIGDFIKSTARLNDTQTLTYLRIIWEYYDSDGPLINDITRLAFKIGAEEITVKLIVDNFFTIKDGFICHERCDKELKGYKAKSVGGKKGANSRWDAGLKVDEAVDCIDSLPIAKLWHTHNYPNGYPMPTQCDPNANHKPITNNQEPITNNHKPVLNTKAEKIPPYEILPWEDGYIDLDEKTQAVVISTKKISKAKLKKPDDVDQEVWDDWVDHRNKKKSAVSDTAIRGARKVAVEVGMSLNEVLTQWVMSGWTGIKADWLKKDDGCMSKAGERNKAILSALTRGASDGNVISMVEATNAPWMAASVAKKIESGV